MREVTKGSTVSSCVLDCCVETSRAVNECELIVDVAVPRYWVDLVSTYKHPPHSTR